MFEDVILHSNGLFLKDLITTFKTLFYVFMLQTCMVDGYMTFLFIYFFIETKKDLKFKRLKN